MPKLRHSILRSPGLAQSVEKSTDPTGGNWDPIAGANRTSYTPDEMDAPETMMVMKRSRRSP